MKFRTGLIVGAGVGYVLGTRAGRKRYEQIVAAYSRIRSCPVIKRAADLTERSTRHSRAVVGGGLVKAAETVRTKATSTDRTTNGAQPDSR